MSTNVTKINRTRYTSRHDANSFYFKLTMDLGSLDFAVGPFLCGYSLRKYKYVERKSDADWIKACSKLVIERTAAMDTYILLAHHS